MGRARRDHQEGGVYNVGNVCGIRIARKLDTAVWSPPREQSRLISISFLYEYDLTDSWAHDVRVERILKPDPNKPYPVCIDGKRAYPPEDCGGPWAYLEILHILKWQYRLEAPAVREFVGANFDPKTFNRGDVNSRMRDYWKNRDGTRLRNHARLFRRPTLRRLRTLPRRTQYWLVSSNQRHRRSPTR